MLNIFNLHNSFGPISFSISYGPYQLFEIVKAFKELGDILKAFYGPLKALISHNFMWLAWVYNFPISLPSIWSRKIVFEEPYVRMLSDRSLKSIKIFNLVNWQGPINFFCFIFNFIFWPFRWNRIKTIERSFFKTTVTTLLMSLQL